MDKFQSTGPCGRPGRLYGRMAEIRQKYLARGLDRRGHRYYINNERVEKEREMLHFLLSLLIPVKIAVILLLVYALLKLMIS